MVNLSIIIPVYNREKTIARALDSIINQLDENTELIIINDGSTDETETIVKQYIIKYKVNISYYAKENEGIAATRNFGITHAKGNYIMFLDSDDYVDKNLIKTLQPYIEEKIDIIKFKATHVNEKGIEIKKIEGPVFSKINGQDAFNKLAFTDVLMDSPCVYTFKKDLFIKNNLFFKTSTYHEDFGLIPLILLLANTVISLNIYGYYYVQTDNSITRNDDYKKTIKRFEDCLLHYDNMLQFINKFSISKLTKDNIKSYYTNAILFKLKLINKDDRKKYIEEINKRDMIKNIKPKNIKQLIKRIILELNIDLYLKLIK